MSATFVPAQTDCVSRVSKNNWLVCIDVASVCVPAQPVPQFAPQAAAPLGEPEQGHLRCTLSAVNKKKNTVDLIPGLHDLLHNLDLHPNDA